MRLGVGVHPTGIGGVVPVILRRAEFHGLAGCLPYSQDALLAIELHHLPAQNLGQFPGGVTSRHIHLPQPVLRGDKTLRKEQVFHVAGTDRGDAVRVANHIHTRLQPGHAQAAIHLRQRVLQHHVQASGSGGEHENYGSERRGQPPSQRMIACAHADFSVRAGHPPRL